MPTFTPSELACQAAPTGQLPPTTTNEQAANRIVGIDQAGEDCRQKLHDVKTKIGVYKDITDQVNAGKKLKP